MIKSRKKYNRLANEDEAVNRESNAKKVQKSAKEQIYESSVIEVLVQKSLEAVHRLIEKGDSCVLKTMLKNGLNSNLKDEDGNTFLHVAVKHAQLECIELFASKVNVNKENKSKRTPLHVAVEHDQLDAVDYLLKKKARVNVQDASGDAPLHLAVRNENANSIKLLLSNKADPNLANKQGFTPFHESLRWIDIDTFDLFLRHKAKVNRSKSSKEGSYLHSVVSSSKIEVITKLLTLAKTNVNELDFSGDTPLQKLMCREDSEDVILEIVKLLIKTGADINLANCKGCTPLTAAIEKKYYRVIRFFLDSGVDSSCFSDSSAILKAVESKDLKMIEFLIIRGFKIEDNLLHSVLALRVDENNCEDSLDEKYLAILKFLIAEGAAINSKNESGQSVLHVALDHNLCKIAEMLTSKGAIK